MPILSRFPGADGKDGRDGSDGFSPVVSTSSISGGHKITITDVSSTQSFDVLDGTVGRDGADGKTAYQSAKDGGYTGTENQFNIDLATVPDKQDKPSLITSGTNITLADNTEYILTNVTTLTLTYPSGNFECWLKITLPTSTYIGAKPTFAKGETWELSIKNGVVIAGKAVSA